MTRAPDWTLEEFRILVANPNVPSEELIRKLPRRSRDAVEVVRQGVHSFHRNGQSPLLSEMMQQQLKSKQAKMTCAICKAKF